MTRLIILVLVRLILASNFAFAQAALPSVTPTSASSFNVDFTKSVETPSSILISNPSSDPTFYVFNSVQFKPGVINLHPGEKNVHSLKPSQQEYTDHLADLLINKNKEKATNHIFYPIPASVIKDDVTPREGQEIWSYIKGDNGFDPIKQKVEELYLAPDADDNYDIEFETDRNEMGKNPDLIFITFPQNIKPEIDSVSFLPISSKEINDVLIRGVKQFIADGHADTTDGVLSKFSSEFKVFESGIVGGTSIKIVSFEKSDIFRRMNKNDGLKAFYCFIDLGDKVLVRENEELNLVMHINGKYYFDFLFSPGGEKTGYSVWRLDDQILTKVFQDSEEYM